jgi:hypothetical protein
MSAFIPFISRRTYDFSSTMSYTTNVIVVRALNVVQWRVGQLVVRVHALNISGTGTMFVDALMTSPSSDAPQTDFVKSTPEVSAGLAAGMQAGELIIENFRSPFGSHLQLRVRAVASAVGGPLSATLSAALYLRERP